MTLREHFEHSGNWLFRQRSHLPLLVLAVILLALNTTGHAGGLDEEALGDVLCFALALAGLAVRVAVIGYAAGGTSGRNTGEQIAATLNTRGMYSLMRHPLYLGNYLMWLGAALLPRVWWCAVIVSLVFWLYYERIMYAEEEFLRGKFGEVWLAWAARTPAFVPAPRRWVAPERRFMVRTVLKREYSALFGIAATFAFLLVARDLIQEGRLELDAGWVVVLGVTAIAYLVLRTLNRRTRLLEVEGR